MVEQRRAVDQAGTRHAVPLLVGNIRAGFHAVFRHTAPSYLTLELLSGYRHLRRAETTLGRNPNCQVRFPWHETWISRDHARITRDQSGYWIENKGKNQTLLNGRRIEERTPLRHGDRLVISKYELLFEDDPDLPLPIPRFQIVSRLQNHSRPGLSPEAPLPAVFDFCRLACQHSLRRTELIDQAGAMLKAVFPAAETIGVLLQRAGLQGRIQVEVCFPLEGRSASLEPDPCMASECLETHLALLCVRLGQSKKDESTDTNGSAMAVPLSTDAIAPFGVLWLAASSP